MATYKLGDKVQIRQDLQAGKLYGEIPATPEMVAMAGSVHSIQRAVTQKTYRLANAPWTWSEEMLVPAKTPAAAKAPTPLPTVLPTPAVVYTVLALRTNGSPCIIAVPSSYWCSKGTKIVCQNGATYLAATDAVEMLAEEWARLPKAHTATAAAMLQEIKAIWPPKSEPPAQGKPKAATLQLFTSPRIKTQG